MKCRKEVKKITENKYKIHVPNKEKNKINKRKRKKGCTHLAEKHTSNRAIDPSRA